MPELDCFTIIVELERPKTAFFSEPLLNDDFKFIMFTGLVAVIPEILGAVL